MVKANANISNELRDVISTIQGYSGSKDVFAALAQEPVQNAKDNPMPNSKLPPTITYKLIEGDQNTILTITDEFTTGLDGKVQDDAEINTHMADGNIEAISNHSAFFADNITTKESRDSSGSRGQGKKAALFHGLFNLDEDERNKRIAMVVDTNTRDENNKNTYRLSVLYFMPRRNYFGPFLDKNAKDYLKEINFSEFETLDGQDITNLGVKESVLKLGLKPLKSTGTRLIIPYLSLSTIEKFKDGTMTKWLERIWWNAILYNKIRIFLEIGDEKIQIKCTDYWKEEPWLDKNLDSTNTKEKGTYVTEDIKIKGTSDPAKKILGKNPTLTIKRIVFDWDSSRSEDEINKGRNANELQGVQWIRNHQWIKTENIKTLSSSLIPNIEDKESFYNGFRAFIEFDDDTCRVLKDDSIETPQHHDVIENVDIRKIDAEVDAAFRECALLNNWLDANVDTSSDNSDAIEDFLELGVWGEAGNNTPSKNLSSSINFDTEDDTNLVKWNQKIENILITLSSTNNKSLREVIFHKNRIIPIRPSGTTKNARWEDIELRLAMIIYKLKGNNVSKGDPLFIKFLQFTGRTTGAIGLRLGNYEAIHNPGTGLKNYPKEMETIYNEYINMDDSELVDIFETYIQDQQESMIEKQEIECILELKKPDNTRINLGKSKSEFDLNEQSIGENTFESLTIDKNTNFDLKKKYELIATWLDAYGVEVASASRTFFVQEKDDTPQPKPYSLIAKFVNLTTDEETDFYSYGDKIKISLSIRNRTDAEYIFHASSSLDSNQLLDSNFKKTIPPKIQSQEFTDFELFTFESEIQAELLDEHNKDSVIILKKGRVEFRIDSYDITELGGKVPSLAELVSNYEIDENQRFIRKNLFIEQDGEGIEYFRRAIVEDESGGGRHIWEFENANYINDPLPTINIFDKHHLRLSSKLNKDTTHASFTEKHLNNLINSEATINILVDRHLESGDDSSEIDKFIDNASRMNTTDTKAHTLYESTLKDLRNISISDTYKKINDIKINLISSLHSMSLAKYKKSS